VGDVRRWRLKETAIATEITKVNATYFSRISCREKGPVAGNKSLLGNLVKTGSNYHSSLASLQTLLLANSYSEIDEANLSPYGRRQGGPKI